MSFKFLHCADLHLGCAQYNLSERYEDFFSAFSYISDLAIANTVNAVFIAGDLFHHRSINAETLSRAAAILQKMKDAGIEVVSVEGNHDKAYYLERKSWQQYLSNRRLFVLLKPDVDQIWSLRAFDGESGSILELNGCRVIGLGYLGGSTKQRLEELASTLEASKKPTVALLHAAIDKLMGQDMAGVSHETLEPYRNKVDYFAMGHIHARAQFGEWAFTPGAPECVHIDEAKRGEKGCYIVEIKKEGNEVSKKIEFISIPHRNVLFTPIDLSGIALDSVQSHIVAATGHSYTKDLLKDSMLCILLIGCPDFSVSSLDVRALEEEIANNFSCLHVEIVNEAGLGDYSLSGTSFDRNALEQAVFQDMSQQSGAKDFIRTAAVISALKTGLLNGDSTEAMLDYLCEEVESCL